MNEETKTKDPEVRRFQAALRLAGIKASDCTAHHVMAIHNKVLEKGDDFTLRDAVAIEAALENLYPDEIKETKKEEKANEEVAEEATA